MEANLMQRLDSIFNRAVGPNQIHEAVLFVQNSNGDFSYSKGYGGKEYSFELTMDDLLFQISGLPDVYEEGILYGKG